MDFPNVIKQWKAYRKGYNANTGEFVGLVSCTLPKVQFEKSEYRAAGVYGSLNLPVVGNVQDMTLTLNFHTPTDAAFNLFNGGAAQVRIVSAVQVYSSDSGTYKEISEELIMNVISSLFDNGKREYSAKGDLIIEGTVTYLATYFDGHLRQQIDPFGGPMILNGTNINAQTMAIVG
jgi:P2 family phage contractile tail tube protein